MKELAEYAGFIDVLESFPVDGWADNGATQLATNIDTLDNAGLLPDTKLRPWISNELLPSVRRVPSWRLTGDRSGLGLAAIAGLLESSDVSQLVFDRVEPVGDKSDIEGLASFANSLGQREISLRALRVSLRVQTDSVVPTLATFFTLVKRKAAGGSLRLISIRLISRQ